MNYKILVDEEFPQDLYQKLDRAQKRIYMQFMTFEGDGAGLELAQKLIEAKKRGVDVKVLIDYYTDFYVSDTYYKKPQVKEEVSRTKKMIEDLRRAKILVYRTRPYGLFGFFFAARNHKKLIIIDNYSYLGGINISDHNYAWHDMMICFNEPKITNALLKDFNNALLGKRINLNEAGIISNDNLNTYYRKIINEAQSELIISSPYFISWNLLRVLRRKKIKTILLTLKENNYSIMNFINKLIFPVLLKNKVKLYFYKKFSHAKFIIADYKKLLVGSSNFCINRFSYSQNIGFYCENLDLVRDFYKRMVQEQSSILEPYTENISLMRYIGALLGLLFIGLLSYPMFVLYAIFSKLYVKEIQKV
ncbi:MAG: phosphatidylserine/phosphatidylglycerophosphate/cardiolipin synthase family protein [candidate division WOR-3 bacterium]|nr:phosphatidylserine/phosphatidylglycerophosphate/cardiolipin synthase family protein [candidate division WOR-3 bacterium]MCX7756951.1 phosphatidylserine/phosphatidylglycerophosphate/cardiolipin synthase family protein [candidate division WOR-3 bacterium]MDW7987723.1 phosphatidylserine/phosphatidylglycerophosphate/cardiolipin synthase family protein [candidate division WOR-3 bacterium]